MAAQLLPRRKDKVEECFLAFRRLRRANGLSARLHHLNNSSLPGPRKATIKRRTMRGHHARDKSKMFDTLIADNVVVKYNAGVDFRALFKRLNVDEKQRFYELAKELAA